MGEGWEVTLPLASSWDAINRVPTLFSLRSSLIVVPFWNPPSFKRGGKKAPAGESEKRFPEAPVFLASLVARLQSPCGGAPEMRSDARVASRKMKPMSAHL